MVLHARAPDFERARYDADVEAIVQGAQLACQQLWR
jgi:hypothetical protein